MTCLTHHSHRRSFIRQATGWAAVTAGSTFLGGCGDGGGDTPSTSAPVAQAILTPTAAAAVPANDEQRLNFALNLSYVTAQFHSFATSGTGLPAALISGMGLMGSVIGARTASLADPTVIAAAAELAADKQIAVATLRAQLGASAAAMPTIDLGGSNGGAFARLRVNGAATLDPYAGDMDYLLGALVLDFASAATIRHLLARTDGAAPAAALGDVLVGSIHQGGLIRTLIDAKSSDASDAATLADAVYATLSALDGTTLDDGMLTDTENRSTNLSDSAGRPIPFTRPTAQALHLAFLGQDGTVGGFLPRGMNGAG